MMMMMMQMLIRVPKLRLPWIPWRHHVHHSWTRM